MWVALLLLQDTSLPLELGWPGLALLPGVMSGKVCHQFFYHQTRLKGNLKEWRLQWEILEGEMFPYSWSWTCLIWRRQRVLILYIPATTPFLYGPWYLHWIVNCSVSLISRLSGSEFNSFFHSIFLTLYFMWDLRRLNKAREIDCAARGNETKKGDFVELGSESPLLQ